MHRPLVLIKESQLLGEVHSMDNEYAILAISLHTQRPVYLPAADAGGNLSTRDHGGTPCQPSFQDHPTSSSAAAVAIASLGASA